MCSLGPDVSGNFINEFDLSLLFNTIPTFHFFWRDIIIINPSSQSQNTTPYKSLLIKEKYGALAIVQM